MTGERIVPSRARQINSRHVIGTHVAEKLGGAFEAVCVVASMEVVGESDRRVCDQGTLVSYP